MVFFNRKGSLSVLEIRFRNREQGFPYIAQERTPQNAAGSVALLN